VCLGRRALTRQLSPTVPSQRLEAAFLADHAAAAALPLLASMPLPELLTRAELEVERACQLVSKVNAALPAVTLSPHIALHPPREVLFYTASARGASRCVTVVGPISRAPLVATDRHDCPTTNTNHQPPREHTQQPLGPTSRLHRQLDEKSIPRRRMPCASASPCMLCAPKRAEALST
jgi:hypothetical protein